jgi:AcrR family transcriptional regulator
MGMAAGQRREREQKNRREEILAAAERVFLCKGFAASSMDEVASEADFTKRTVYRYFDGKEELLFEAAARLLDRFRLEVDEGGDTDSNAGARLKVYVDRFYSVIREHPREASLMHDALAMRSGLRRRGGAETTRPGFSALERNLERMYASFVGTVAAGAADGSLRNDLVPEGAAFSVFFLLKGFLEFVADGEAGAAVPGRMSGDELASYTLELMIEGMRP